MATKVLTGANAILRINGQIIKPFKPCSCPAIYQFSHTPLDPKYLARQAIFNALHKLLNHPSGGYTLV